jgi:hypothetical protein
MVTFCPADVGAQPDGRAGSSFESHIATAPVSSRITSCAFNSSVAASICTCCFVSCRQPSAGEPCARERIQDSCETEHRHRLAQAYDWQRVHVRANIHSCAILRYHGKFSMPCLIQSTTRCSGRASSFRTCSQLRTLRSARNQRRISGPASSCSQCMHSATRG